jgi:hypothetical protein
LIASADWTPNNRAIPPPVRSRTRRSDSSPVDAGELRARAQDEAEELGPEPADPRGRWQCDEEWRGAVELLAALASYDAAALRQAALDVAENLDKRTARALFLDAAEVRGG